MSENRFISLAPNITETVAYLGDTDLLVGITNDCDYPPEIQNITRVGKYTYPDMEKIIVLQPANVLLEASADPRFKAKLQDLKIRYFDFELNSFTNYFSELRRLNEMLYIDFGTYNSDEKVEALERLWQKKYPPLNKKVAIVVWQNPLMAAGQDTFLNDFFAGLGCENILTKATRYPEISRGQLYEADIVFNISGQPWTLTEGQRVIDLDANIYSRLSPRLIQARENTYRQISAEEIIAQDNFSARSMLRDYRTLRIVMALLVGAGLALSGLLYQAMLQNSLAEPYLLGVSSGAAVGALSGMLFNLFPFGTAIAGALGALILVYIFARKNNKIDNNGLILSGVMLNAFCGALIMLSVFFAGDKVNSLMFWLMGDLGMGLWPQVWLIGAVLALTAAFALWQSGRIELLSIGDEQAESLGVEVGNLKTILLILVSALTAVIVASVGIIGFVGLIIPHIVKMLCGERLSLNILLTLIFGALFLAVSDLAARALVPEIVLPVGIITALLGVPFFVLIYKKAE